MTIEEIEERSAKLVEKFLASDAYKNAKTVYGYLPYNQEVRTTRAMEQVLTRRFRRMLDGDEKFVDRPDLLLIDGGREHVQVARRVLEGLGLDIPAYGMVKDDRHRTRALVHPDGREIGIQAVPALFALVGQIQEETHRFAIEYHRQIQSSHVKTSVLEKIPGVGEKRRTQLLKHFKTIKAIRNASLEQLEKVVPKNTAKAVYEYFRQEDKS